MKEKRSGFHLRLNLFDGIVLAAALLAAVLLVWGKVKPASEQAPGAAPSTVRYTFCMHGCLKGTGNLVQPGDSLTDNIKNMKMGNVVSSRVEPAKTQVINERDGKCVLAPIEGCEDVFITVEAPCTARESSVKLDGGYEIRVGMTAYVRGAGYMGSGPIVSIEREDPA